MRSGIHPDGTGESAIQLIGTAWNWCCGCKKRRPASADFLGTSNFARTNPKPTPYRLFNTFSSSRNVNIDHFCTTSAPCRQHRLSGGAPVTLLL